MAAAEVLQKLANSSTKLSDALRAASILPEVIGYPELAAWVNSELAGYREDVEVPPYRRRRFTVRGNASNGAWYHKGTTVPVHSFGPGIRAFAESERHIRQNVGSLESLISDIDGNVQIPFPTSGIGLMNNEIASGTTGVDDTYAFTEVWFEVPRPVLVEILERVRQQAISEIAKRVAPEDLAIRAAEAAPAVPASFTVEGSGNQIIVGSPGTTVTLNITAGDRAALDDALASLGIQGEAIEELHDLIDDGQLDEPAKVMRALDWSRRAATSIGVSTAANAASGLILQYLGQLL